MEELDKRKYIFNKINNREINHGYIKTFVIQNDIKFTENMNGIFVNLTLLDRDIIDELYNYIYDYLHNYIEENRDTILNDLKIENELKSIEKKKNKPYINQPKKIYKEPPQLTNIEKDIIELSKKI